MQASNAPAAPLFIVLNAASGHSDTETTFRAIADALNAAGRSHEILRVEDAAQLDVIAKQAVTKAQQVSGVVVGVGGDGTLRTVAQATLGKCHFGVIPQGTFNYFGRTHGISSDAAEATRGLLNARMRRVQVGLVNDRVFLVNASVGLYPKLLQDREETKKRHGYRSRLLALWAAVLTLWRGYRPMRIKLEYEGKQQELRALTLFVGNNRLQLEQVGLQADAVDDGKLVAILLRPVPTLTLFWLALRGAMRNLAQASGVDHFVSANLTVTPSSRREQRMRIAADGEIEWIRTPLEFRVAPEPLLLVTPLAAVPETAQ